MPRLTPLAGLMAGLAPATLITAASLLGSTAMAATISAPSRLSDVTVYPDAATIRRVIEVDIPAGEHELKVDDLPGTIDPASLRIEGEGSDRLLLGNVHKRGRGQARHSAETDRPAP
jgi:hypothetical protein